MRIKKNTYPDGTFYTESHLDSPDFTYFVNSYEDLWALGQVLENAEYRKYPVTVTIPNLIDAQADRRFWISQPHALKLVLRFLNQFKNVDYKIFHPHNQEVVELGLDKVEIIDNYFFIKEALTEINPQVLMSSDAGGFKPLMKLCDKLAWKYDVYSASKSREYKEGRTKLTQIVDKNDFEGKDILIVDDICVKGGTFVGLAKLLRERNIGKLYLAVSHLTLPEVSKELVDSFDMIFTTNSKGWDEYSVKPYENNGHDRVYPQLAENIKVIKMF